jgi:hypothetical protein
MVVGSVTDSVKTEKQAPFYSADVWIIGALKSGNNVSEVVITL